VTCNRGVKGCKHGGSLYHYLPVPEAVLKEMSDSDLLEAIIEYADAHMDYKLTSHYLAELRARLWDRERNS
jgi:hypothetical protein